MNNQFLKNLLTFQYNLDPSDINIIEVHENRVKVEINGEIEIHELKCDYRGLAKSMEPRNMQSTHE